MDKNNLSKYERQQIEEIRKWRNQKPGKVKDTINNILGPAASKISNLIPESFMQAFINTLNGFGGVLADEKDICKSGKVGDITELLDKRLELCDKLANNCQNWAVGMASVEGAATGATGILGIALDIPGVMLLALRTIHKIGLCYGFRVNSESDKIIILEIFALSSSSTIGEKNSFLVGKGFTNLTESAGAAAKVLNSATEPVSELATAETVRSVGKKTMSKAGSFTVGNPMFQQRFCTFAGQAVKTTSKDLVEKGSSKTIPALGAGLGLIINANYISSVGWTARRCFQKWWLEQNGKWDNEAFEDVETKPIFSEDV